VSARLAPPVSGDSGAARAGRWIGLLAFVGLASWAVWSYAVGGVVGGLFEAAADGERSLAWLRAYVDRAGVFGPLAYVGAVTVEVVVAPLPGTLLYAPGGAIFGGGLGGTLSLAGNVIGAMLAAAIARLLGRRITDRLEHSDLQRHASRVRERSLLIIALLRVNPFTSSDLVSYAAGLVGVSIWRVGTGTLIGMAPLCYAQAYAAETIFARVPGSGLILIGSGLVYAGLVVWLLVRPARRRRGAIPGRPVEPVDR
jgi:uncharacterized membrane protein YdjX (TVP38/TMEM64 family)